MNIMISMQMITLGTLVCTWSFKYYHRIFMVQLQKSW